MNATVKRAELLDALGAIKPYLGKRPELAFYVLAPGPKDLIAYTWNGNDALMIEVKARTVAGKDVVLLPPGAVAFLSAVTAKDVTLSSTVKVEKQDLQGKGHYDYSVQPSKWIEGEVEHIKIRHYTVHVAAGSSHTSYPTGDPDAFKVGLTMADIKNLKSVSLPQLSDGLEECSYALAKGREQYDILRTVCMASTKRGLDLVACDGYRLAVVPLTTKAKLPERLAIADAVVAVLKGWKGRTTIRWKAKANEVTRIVFQNGPYTLVTSNVGTYPDYTKMLPPKLVKGIVVSNKALTEAVKVCSTLVGAEGTVRLVTKGKNLQVIGLIDGSESVTEFPVKGRIKQAYTAKYLLEMLKHVGETVEIRHPAGHGTFAIAIVRSGSAYHVMMPREVDEWRPKPPPTPAVKSEPLSAVAAGG